MTLNDPVMYRNQTFNFADFLANAVHLAVREYGRFLPYEKRVLLGRDVAGFMFANIPKFRARVHHNLALIFPDMSPAWRDYMFEESARNVGQSLTEHMHIDDFAERIGNLNITGQGAALLNPDQGAILITGHFGQWEGVRLAWRHVTGQDCGFFFRPNNNGFYDRNWQAYLRRAGEPIFPKGGHGKAAMHAHLGARGAVLFANDQHLAKAEYFDFLGRPARTATTAASLALEYDMPLIPAFALRRSNLFDYDVVFDVPIPPSDAATMTQAANDALGARIRERPEQYFWAHRRWR